MKSVLLLSGAALALTAAIAVADPRPNTGETMGQRNESLDRPDHRGGMMMDMPGMRAMQGMQTMRSMMMGDGHGMHAQMQAQMHERMHGGAMDRDQMENGAMPGGGMHDHGGGQYPRPSQPDQK
jgi:hypothetical protein